MKKHTIFTILSLMAASLFISCQREELQDSGLSGNIIHYSPAVSRTELSTKGELVNTSGSDAAFSTSKTFFVSAWTGTAKDFDYEKVVYRTANGGYWITVFGSGDNAGKDKEYIWKKGADKTFYAYANLPASGAAVTGEIVGGKPAQKLVYTVPATAAAQNDILLGYYSNGTTAKADGNVPVKFYHPLTAVQFKYGTIADNLGIKSITLSGVVKSGTATMNPDGSDATKCKISWGSFGTYDGSFSQSDASGLSVDGTSKLIGEPFIIIPQNLVAKQVTVTVKFNDTGETTATALIKTGEWQAGCTNTYTLKYEGVSPMEAVLTVTLEDWQTLTNKTGGDEFDVTFGTKPTE